LDKRNHVCFSPHLLQKTALARILAPQLIQYFVSADEAAVGVLAIVGAAEDVLGVEGVVAVSVGVGV